jgi:hypothetical protein
MGSIRLATVVLPARNAGLVTKRSGDEKTSPGKQQNVRFPTWMLDRAKDAAKWEGLTFSAYLRSALLQRIRRTDSDRAKNGVK